MIKALLFDLDGTLLQLEMEIFLKYYFKAMMDYANEWDFSEGSYLVEQVWKATDVMVNNLDPLRSNEDVFMKSFLPHFDCKEERIRDFFENFYSQRFPVLRDHCQAYAQVPRIVEQAFAKGYKVAIATNPVFPMVAVEHRLNWAGIGDLPFKLVTSYENMHFCKPQIQYYQEIAERIGEAPSSCLMIGNDTREDLAAGKIGMKTFLLKDGLIDRGDGYGCDWEGYLGDLEAFIDALPTI